MLIADHIACQDLLCRDVIPARFTISPLEIDAESIRCVMVSESPAPDPDDDFHAPGEPFFLKTTVQAFADAGFPIASMGDVLELGVYITTAVKCGKVGYAVPTAAIKACSGLLEAELSLFPNLTVILAMGDVAIATINEIGRRQTGRRTIPAGSTYKLRGPEYFLDGIRVFPSYLQTGKSFLIEKSKREMIAEDLRTALGVIGRHPR